jgi:hypothetical protein
LGQTWTPTSLGPTALAQSMVANPGDGDRVVAAATSCTVWVTSDGGANWAEPLTGFGGIGYCTPRLAWPSAGLFAVARGNVYSSNDGGLNWTVVGTPPDGELAYAFLVLPTTPATIYVGTEAGTVQLSTNGGATWVDRSTGLPASTPENPFPGVYRLAVDPADNSVLYAEVDSHGLFRTANGGVSWAAVTPPSIPSHPANSPVTLATTPTASENSGRPNHAGFHGPLAGVRCAEGKGLRRRLGEHRRRGGDSDQSL